MKNFLQVLLVGTVLVGAGDGFAKVVAVTNPEGGGLAKNILDYGNDAESLLVKGGANSTLAQQFGWWESNIYGANKGWDVYGVKDLNSISGNGSYNLYDTDTGKLVGSYNNGTILYNQTGKSMGLEIPSAASAPKVEYVVEDGLVDAQMTLDSMRDAGFDPSNNPLGDAAPATPSSEIVAEVELPGEEPFFVNADGENVYVDMGLDPQNPYGMPEFDTQVPEWNLNGTSEWDVMQSKTTDYGGTLTEYRNGSQVYEIDGTKYIKKAGESYFQDADGDVMPVTDPEAYTGFGGSKVETTQVVSTDAVVTDIDGEIVTVEVNGREIHVDQKNIKGNLELGGKVSVSVPVANIPSSIQGGITAQVLEINGDMAKVSMYGMEYNLPTSKLGQLYKNGATTTTVLRPEALGSLTQGLGGYINAGLGNVGATFGNYFGAFKGLVTKPFSMVKGLWNDAGGTLKGAWDGFTEGLGRIPENVQAIFGAGDKVISGTSAVDSLLKAQKIDASKLTAEQQAALASKIAQAFPIRIWNYGEYATVIMQSLEAGKQNDTTKEVKVKAENALLASQGASTDSTVGKNVSLQGTNLASAASQMALLLDANPVDLNLLKMNDLDLKKDKDQKTLRQRRDLLLQMYATSAQIIAEGSNDISEKFYERIEQLSESLPKTTGSLGSASVLNDSERYPYFEMVRQTALTATQLGLKGASILPNLRIVAPESQEQ